MTQSVQQGERSAHQPSSFINAGLVDADELKLFHVFYPDTVEIRSFAKRALVLLKVSLWTSQVNP